MGRGEGGKGCVVGHSPFVLKIFCMFSYLGGNEDWAGYGETSKRVRGGSGVPAALLRVIK